jgi:HEAT repeat protein
VRRIVDAEGREIHDVEQLFGEGESKTVREAFGRFFDEVRALRRDVQADGATLAVVVFPFRFQVAATGAPPPTAQQQIAGFCKADGIPCLDLLPRLRIAGEAAFVDYDHLSPLGARLAAEAVAESGLVPPTEPWPGLSPGDALADLHHEDPRRRVRAAQALAAKGKAASPAAPRLFEALADPSENVRWAAAQALWKIEPPAEVALPSLVPALRNSDPYVRGFAAWSLGNFGAAAKDAVPALIETVRAEEKDGRGAAILALARIGPSASSAAPVLIETLHGARGPRRADAARALGRIGAPEAVPALSAALKDESDHVRAFAARALGKLGPTAAGAVDALTAATKDDNEHVRHEAGVALKRIRGLEVTPGATRGESETE